MGGSRLLPIYYFLSKEGQLVPTQHTEKKFDMTQPRNIATILSIIPGLGQLYNRRIVKGLLFFIVSIAFLIVFWDFLDIGIWGAFLL